MSTSAMSEGRRRAWRPVWAYALTAALALGIHLVYQLFAHGVQAAAMTWMFLYPLVGGVLFYAVLAWRWPDGREAPGFRLFMNLYNAGIAALTVGSFLRGVLVIAGAESPYAWVLPALGWTLAGLGLVTLMIWRMRCRKPAG